MVVERNDFAGGFFTAIMGMGQAAGTAAAMSIGSSTGPRELNINALQGRLVTNGAILEAP